MADLDDWEEWEPYRGANSEQGDLADDGYDPDGEIDLTASGLEVDALYDLRGTIYRAKRTYGRWRLEPRKGGETLYVLLDRRIMARDGTVVGDQDDLDGPLWRPTRKPSWRVRRTPSIILPSPPVAVRQRTRISEQQCTVLLLLFAVAEMPLRELLTAVYRLGKRRPTPSQRAALSRTMRRLRETGYVGAGYKNTQYISVSGRELIQRLVASPKAKSGKKDQSD